MNNKTIYIFDDIYGKSIYSELQKILPNYNFPIKTNILDPLIYIDEILKEEPFLVLLDHWFIDNNLMENQLGSRFLAEIDKNLEYEEIINNPFYLFWKKPKRILKYKNIKTIFISISDNWTRLKTNLFYKKYIKDYIKTKRWNDIYNIIKKIYKRIKRNYK